MAAEKKAARAPVEVCVTEPATGREVVIHVGDFPVTPQIRNAIKVMAGVQAVDIDLRAQADGLCELRFLPLGQRQRFELRSLPLHPGAQVSVTLSADAGAPVALGLLALGSWDSLVGDDCGGVTYGARASMVSYSHRKLTDDGTMHRVRRGSAARLECEVFLPAAQANRALELLHRAQGRAVAFVATSLASYDYLSGFGDLSGHITASGPQTRRRVFLRSRHAMSRLAG